VTEQGFFDTEDSEVHTIHRTLSTLIPKYPPEAKAHMTRGSRPYFVSLGYRYEEDGKF
jgi:hypothetical protein